MSKCVKSALQRFIVFFLKNAPQLGRIIKIDSDQIKILLFKVIWCKRQPTYLKDPNQVSEIICISLIMAVTLLCGFHISKKRTNYFFFTTTTSVSFHHFILYFSCSSFVTVLFLFCNILSHSFFFLSLLYFHFFFHHFCLTTFCLTGFFSFLFLKFMTLSIY